MADPDLDHTAGEFVLGTLDTQERTAFLRVMARDPEAVRAVADWQEKFAPLALGLAPVAPSAGLYPRIEASLDGPTPAVPANDNSTGWRWTALAASLVALVSVGVAVRQASIVPVTPAPLIQRQLVAYEPTAIGALAGKSGTPVLFLTYDEKTGRVKVVPAKVDADAAHSLELWLIQGGGAPKSVGLIDPDKSAQLKLPTRAASDAVFAVSQEPLGGSKTGAPTGPVLWTGSLLKL